MPLAPEVAHTSRVRDEQLLRMGAWALSAAVALIAFIAWGQSWHWRLNRMSAYNIFPLLGLLAFSIMWSHYVVSAVRQAAGVRKEALKLYISVTGLAVLGLILLHPGLLAWQLWHDGFGLPPGSTKYYVGSAMYGAVILGLIALTLFLLYELHRWYESKPWWLYFSIATDIAMVMIYIHSLLLGSQLKTGWLRLVWYFYGVTLAAALIYAYAKRWRSQRAQP